MSAYYPDYADPAAAVAALNDPRTPPAVLQQIAAQHPELRPQVAAHPAAYPELVAWIRASGGPAPFSAPQAKRGGGKVVAIVVAVAVVIAGGGTAFAAMNGLGPFAARPAPTVPASPHPVQPTVTPTPTPTPTVIETPTAPPVEPRSPVWDGGVKQAWSVAGKSIIGPDYNGDLSLTPVSDAVWLAEDLVGDVTIQMAGLDAASGKKLWDWAYSGRCADQATSGGLICLDGNWGSLDVIRVDLATGKTKRLAKTSALRWPAAMVASDVVPMGDDVIVTGSQALSGGYDGWVEGDTWIARLGPDGTAK